DQLRAPADEERRRIVVGTLEDTSDLSQELDVYRGSPPLLEDGAEVVAEVGLVAIDELFDHLDEPRRHVPPERVDVDRLSPGAPLLDEAGERIPVGLVAQLRETGPDPGLRRLFQQGAVDERLDEERGIRKRPDRVARPLFRHVFALGDRGQAQGRDARGRRLGELRHLPERDIRFAQPLGLLPDRSVSVEPLEADLVPLELERRLTRLFQDLLERRTLAPRRANGREHPTNAPRGADDEDGQSEELYD